MRVDESKLELLERQATHIDSLEMYVRACARRGIEDESAERTLTHALRLYRRTLSRLSVDELFEFACRTARPRQS